MDSLMISQRWSTRVALDFGEKCSMSPGTSAPKARKFGWRSNGFDGIKQWQQFTPFSGGGYNAALIWQQLNQDERDRIRKVVVIGSPGVNEENFPGAAEVVIRADPPEGHMAGPKALLESLHPESQGSQN
jgi:hypothetical protein